MGTWDILQQLGKALAQELPGCIADSVRVNVFTVASHGNDIA
jgi:hypothetical protein